MKLDSIYALWAEDSKIDRLDLGEESLKISSLHQKYSQIYTNEKIRLREYEAALKVLKLEKYEFYTQGPTNETQEKGWELPAIGKIIRSDVQQYIEADKEIIELTLKIGIQNEKVSLLDSIIKNLFNRGFQIKNAIDWMKYASGG
jgi:hypothetical protein